MKRLDVALMILAAVLNPGRTPAQDPPIQTGMRVRVTALERGVAGATAMPSNGVVGYLYHAHADSLWLHVDSPDGPVFAIDRTNIGQLEISNGRTRHPVKGALWGAGIGLGIGLLAVASLDDCTVSTRRWSVDLCWIDEDVVILGDMLAGAAVGAVVGLFFTSERWVPVPSSSLAVVRAAGRARLGIGLRLRF